MKVVVIGAGLGGLATALRLQALGADVTVLERRRTPGGRAGQITDRGFTWDTGPSLITMPWVLEETFAAGGLDLHSEVNLHPLDPFYRIQWAGEPQRFDFRNSREGLAAEIEKFSAADAARLDPFLDALAPIYEQGIIGAGRRAIQDVRTFMGLLPMMARYRAMGPLHGFVSRYFSHPRIQEAFSFHSLFIGGDPYRVPAIYAALIYLQVLDGVWYSDGGVYSLIEAMARPLDVRYRELVEGIETRGGRVTGVRTVNGERIDADVVISNADVLSTQTMLGRSSELRRLTPTMSCFLLYLGLDRVQPSLLHHTLLVGREYRRFIESVTKTRTMPGTFSTYLHAPTRTEAAMAPPGGDSLAILLPVPNLRGQIDWAAHGDGLRDSLIADLENTFGLEGLEASITAEHRWTPLDFRDQYGAVAGNAFSLEPTLAQSALFRPPNRVRGVEGMYHVGAGTHPGAGIPGVLLGAEVTAGLVAMDHNLDRARWSHR